MESERPLLKPYVNFRPMDDAIYLQTATRDLYTNKGQIFDILTKRNDEQRRTILKAYSEHYENTLLVDLRHKVSADAERMLLAMLTPPLDLRLEYIHEAISAPGTHEQALIEMLCPLSPTQLAATKDAYQAKYGRNLLEALEGEPSTYFRRLLVIMHTGNRSNVTHDLEETKKLSASLLSADVDRVDTDESEFTRILGRYSYPLLSSVFEEYRKIKGRTIQESIEREVTEDHKDNLIKVIRCIENKHQFFARCLHDAMLEDQTNVEVVTRILVTRAEIDLGTIKDEYKKMYDKQIIQDMKTDVSSEYYHCIYKVLEE